MGRLTRRQPVVRISAASMTRRTETLAVEEPLEIRLDGDPWQVTMRTPGDDIDLVHGLLHAEQVITGAEQVVVARYCAGAGTGPGGGLNPYNVLDITLGAGARSPTGPARAVVTSSACGICGTTTIDQVLRESRYAASPTVRLEPAVLAGLPQRLREQQRVFDKTGGLHAAGLARLDGVMACVREDVGRHNAVDKVIGWALRNRKLPLAASILCVSGRASFELTQKAVLAGLPAMVAVSAPSSLAVELAERAGLTLVGFARGESMNVYTHPERVAL